MSIWKNLFGTVPTITVTELQDKLRQKPGPILVDVRTTTEYRNGHINGADSIPLEKLEERFGKLSKNREIICICQSGSRSKRATRQLQNAGFTAVNVKGGMNAWAKQGLSTKAGKVK